jgi:predicted transcriptional regulator
MSKDRTVLGGITISTDLESKLSLLSAVEKTHKSTVIETALKEYFERNPGKVYTINKRK